MSARNEFLDYCLTYLRMSPEQRKTSSFTIARIGLSDEQIIDLASCVCSFSGDSDSEERAASETMKAIRNWEAKKAEPILPEKRFLGDAVYASHDGVQIWLEVSDGFKYTDRIALLPGVLSALNSYAQYCEAFFKEGEEA